MIDAHNQQPFCQTSLYPLPRQIEPDATHNTRVLITLVLVYFFIFMIIILEQHRVNKDLPGARLVQEPRKETVTSKL